MMPNRLRLAALLLAGLASAPALAQDFEARLGRVPVDSRTQSDIAGSGRATAELDGDRLEVVGEFEGLKGPATSASLHMGRAVGVRGPAIHALTISPATEGELEASVRLSAGQIEALRAGRLYIRIDSEPAPDGNLWGWLLNE